jgi:acetyl esterase/lipase
LLALRDGGEPLPALGLGLCPWTDPGCGRASLMGNNRYDWVQGGQTIQFSEWHRGGIPPDDPRVCPHHADLRDLPPLVLHAGGREILHDMIVDFAGECRRQGGDVTLQVWPDMNHDFHAYGLELPESREALSRLRAAVDARCGNG